MGFDDLLVADTLTSLFWASAAAANPTEVVPPRISERSSPNASHGSGLP
jgi:hypothetical protein